VEDSILMEGCRIIDAGGRIAHSLIGRDVEIVRDGVSGNHRFVIGDQSRIELP
jgi:NDP-sugar pyrophosphorylase family protein